MSDPFAPHNVYLVGHRRLGIVSARWRGPFLEVEGKPGEPPTVYGPSAIYSVQAVKPPPALPGPDAVAEVLLIDDGHWRTVEACLPASGFIVLSGGRALKLDQWAWDYIAAVRLPGGETVPADVRGSNDDEIPF